jgi:hypothetical protein
MIGHENVEFFGFLFLAQSLSNSLWWLEKRVEATTNQRFPSSSSSCS